MEHKNKKARCKVEGCERMFYAKGFCRQHYAYNLRTGHPFPVPRKPKECYVYGCHEVARVKGLCKFHYYRVKNGVPVHRPYGVKGELNPNWNGGISEYPNHYQMKIARKQVLVDANWVCFFCGGKADRIHHRDLSKDNHSKDNLVASCAGCNAKHRQSTKTSKFIRRYGKTLLQIAQEFGKSVSWVANLHSKGKLAPLLQRRLPEEIQEVLF